MIVLRQSTAIKVRIGPFVDKTDSLTPETGIALGSADEAELLKANGAATVDISGNTWAAITGPDGWYDLSLTTTDTNTLGELVVVVQDDSVCLPVYKRFQVVSKAVFDTMYEGLAITFGTVNTGVFTPSATQFACDDITEATADHFIGRVVCFTTGVLKGQSSLVTDYALASSEGKFTVSAMTEAPGNNDECVIV